MVEVWGIEKFNPNSRRLKLFDFSYNMDGSLWAYPVFTSREAAMGFVEAITEDATGPDAEKFRQMSRECVRQVSPREIPRTSLVMVNTTALRDPGDNVASVGMKWGQFYDERVAETN